MPLRDDRIASADLVAKVGKREGKSMFRPRCDSTCPKGGCKELSLGWLFPSQREKFRVKFGDMSLSIIGPWLLALRNRAQEAGHSEAVNIHPGPAQGTSGHVAHGADSHEPQERFEQAGESSANRCPDLPPWCELLSTDVRHAKLPHKG